MPSNPKGKNLVWKIYWNLPLNLRVLPSLDADEKYLQKVMPSFSDFEYLQKVNAKCPQISDEKLMFFIRNLRAFCIQFFIRNLRAFCIHFLQVLKIRKWRHYLLQVIPSDLEGNFSTFFRRSFFPFNALGMPSFNNSVCYVYLEQSFAKKHYGSYLLLLWYAYKY